MFEQLEQRMREIAQEEIAKKFGTSTTTLSTSPTITTTTDRHTAITNTLNQFAINPAIKGYRYLREAVLMVAEDIEVLNHITKQLYPSLAAKFNTTPSRVERAIRHAIEIAMERNTPKVMELFAGYRPTSSEFIARLAEDMRGA